MCSWVSKGLPNTSQSDAQTLSYCAHTPPLCAPPHCVSGTGRLFFLCEGLQV